MAKLMLLSAVATGLICAIGALLLAMFADVGGKITVMGISFVFGFLGSCCAQAVMRRGG